MSLRVGYYFIKYNFNLQCTEKIAYWLTVSSILIVSSVFHSDKMLIVQWISLFGGSPWWLTEVVQLK